MPGGVVTGGVVTGGGVTGGVVTGGGVTGGVVTGGVVTGGVFAVGTVGRVGVPEVKSRRLSPDIPAILHTQSLICFNKLTTLSPPVIIPPMPVLPVGIAGEVKGFLVGFLFPAAASPPLVVRNSSSDAVVFPPAVIPPIPDIPEDCPPK